MTTAIKTIQELDQEYNEIDALRSSALVDIIKSPGDYYSKYIAKTMPPYESYAMDLGSKIHAFLLQPELLDVSYKTFPIAPCLAESDLAEVMGSCRWKTLDIQGEPGLVYLEEPKTPDAKKRMYDALGEYYGQAIITPEETKQIIRLSNDLKENPQTRDVLNKVDKTEMVLTTETDGIPLKCKLDMLTSDGWIIDYKSFERPINDELIMYTIKDRYYYVQAALYTYIARQNGLDIKGFKWIFQRKSSGQCCVAPCYEEMIEYGMRKIKLGLEKYARCMATGIWPDWLDPETGATNYDSEIDLTKAMSKIFGIIRQEEIDV